jgi:hypothetical protein
MAALNPAKPQPTMTIWECCLSKRGRFRFFIAFVVVGDDGGMV